MKKFLIFTLILSAAACSKDDNKTETNNSYLSKVEYYLENDENPWKTIEIGVDEKNQINSISSLTEVSLLIYSVNEETSIIQEDYEFYPNPNSTQWTKTYDIQHIEDDIWVTETNSDLGNKMIFSFSDGYVDEYKFYTNNENTPYQRIVFKRNESNQIVTIESYTTEGQSDELEIRLWKLTFSNYSLDSNFPSFSNPVFGSGLYTFYNYTISDLLGLKISSNPPLNSEVSIDNNSVDNISIELISKTTDNKPERLNYNLIGTKYSARFSY